MANREKWLKIVRTVTWCLMAGGLIALYFCTFQMQLKQEGNCEVFVCTGAAVCFLAWAGTWFFTPKAQRNISKKKMAVTLAVVAACTLALSVAVESRAYKNTWVSVELMEETNEETQGREAEIVSLTVDGKTLDLSSYETDGWQLTNEETSLLTVKPGKPIQFNLKPYRELNIGFVDHAWAGVVAVCTPNEILYIDLYAPETEERHVEVPYAQRRQAEGTLFFAILFALVLFPVALELFLAPDEKRTQVFLLLTTIVACVALPQLVNPELEFWQAFSGIAAVVFLWGILGYDLRRQHVALPLPGKKWLVAAAILSAAIVALVMAFSPNTQELGDRGLPFAAVYGLVMVFLVFILLCVAYLPLLRRILHGPTPKGGRQHISPALYWPIALLVPWIFLFFLYYRNKQYMSIAHVFLAGLFFSLVSAGLFWLLGRKRTDKMAVALVVGAAWIYFFTFGAMYTAIQEVFSVQLGLFCLVSSLLAGIVLAFIYRLGMRFQKKDLYCSVNIMLIVLLLLNFVPSVLYAAQGNTAEDKQYRENFTVDRGAPNPNIYWFHQDGMLNFAIIEDYFGDGQVGLKTALQERGFVINEDAWFEALHRTNFSVPSMMSPDFYDSAIAPHLPLEELDENEDYDRYDKLIQYFDTPGFQQNLTEARENNELITALQEAGYYTSTISTFSNVYFPITNRFYELGEGIKYESVTKNVVKTAKNISWLTAMKELLCDTTMLVLIEPALDQVIAGLSDSDFETEEIPVSREDVDDQIGPYNPQPYHINGARSLADAIDSPEPRFVVFHAYYAYGPYPLDEEGIVAVPPEEMFEIGNYLGQHHYASTVLINQIDMILENDPDAVIVLQADHGIHTWPSIDNMRDDLGLSYGEARDFWNSTFSAVRIPEEYGGLSEPLDPLNISRELVNRFVGPNYELLPANQPNQKNP